MCVAAAALPLAKTLGAKTAAAFWGKLAINTVTNVFSTIRQRKIANQQAQYQYAAAARQAESADQAFRAENEARGSRLKEDRITNAKKRLALAKKGVEARGALRASERAGLALNILDMDQTMQFGPEGQSLDETDISLARQYGREMQGAVARRNTRRNQALDTRNRGFQIASQAPSLLGTIARSAAGGMSDYYSLVAKA
jgi:hypothetical protein